MIIKTAIAIALLLFAAPVLAQQSSSPALSTDPQQIESLIQQTGCRAEVSAAAQTIASLQKQVNDLQKKLQAADPPKSGATKH
jgi:peptidoglycan hydrolase CwlO-like protein